MTQAYSVGQSDIAPFVYATQLKRVQRFTYGMQLNREGLRELANAGFVEHKEDIPRVPFALDFNETDLGLAQDQLLFDTSGSVTLPSGILGGIPYLEFRVPIRWDGVFSETDWISRAAVERWSMTFPVTGLITKTVSGTADHLVHYFHALKDAYVLRGTRSAPGTFTVSGDISTGYEKITARVNSDVFIPADKLTIGTFSGGNTTITVASPYDNLAEGDRIVFVYSKTTPADYPALSGTGIGGLKRGCADLFLFRGGVTQSKWLRVQNATIDVPLGVQEMLEVGSAYPIKVKPAPSFTITLNVTVTRSQLEDFAIFAGKTYDQSLTSLSVRDLVRTAHFKAFIYSSDTDKTAPNLVKVITVEDLSVNGCDYSASVGDTPNEVTWNLQADNIVISAS